jgi:hypothetical protein
MFWHILDILVISGFALVLGGWVLSRLLGAAIRELAQNWQAYALFAVMMAGLACVELTVLKSL